MGKIINPDVLRELLDYDPATGKLFWKARSAKWFMPPWHRIGVKSAHARANAWNGKWAGKEAFTSCYNGKYHGGAVLSAPYLAHRVAYSLHYNVCIVGEIDHINGDYSDNRIVNLREVDHTGNARNTSLYSTNTSGTPGVMWEESHKAWSVKISFNGKQRRIGRFKKKSEAIAARKHAETVHGYHPNHGRLTVGG